MKKIKPTKVNIRRFLWESATEGEYAPFLAEQMAVIARWDDEKIRSVIKDYERGFKWSEEGKNVYGSGSFCQGRICQLEKLLKFKPTLRQKIMFFMKINRHARKFHWMETL